MDNRNINNAGPDGDVVAGATGGAGGAVAGAALGSLAGPIGTIIGGLAGAVGGWWAGKAVADSPAFNDEDDAFYREHHSSRYASGNTADQSTGSRPAYNDVRPAYQLGHLAALNPDYRDRSFDEVEPHLSSAYGSAFGSTGSNASNTGGVGSTGGMGSGSSVGSASMGGSSSGAGMSGSSGSAGMGAAAGMGMGAGMGSSSSWNDVRPYAYDAWNRGREVAPQRFGANADRGTFDSANVGSTGSSLGDYGRDLKTGAANMGDKIADAADDLKDRVDGNPASRPGRDSTDRTGR